MSMESASNDFLKIANRRFSYRGYKDQEIPQSEIDYLLECSRLAPSAANKQPWKIHIVRDRKLREGLHQSYTRNWLLEAPLIVVFTGTRGQNWIRRDGADYLMCDVTIIADHFIMSAAERGLGTCYIAAFEPEIVKNVLSLDENEIPYLMTPLGYPVAGARKERQRKDLSEIACYH